MSNGIILNGGTLNQNLNGGTQMEISLFRSNKSAVTMNGGAINIFNSAAMVIGSAGSTG